jgi:predicted ATPase
VARYLDEMAVTYGATPPDFLSHSHGEGFLRFFEERCQRQGIFIFDEPESALSPSRQIEFLKLLHRMDRSGICQVIMATHAPLGVILAWLMCRSALPARSRIDVIKASR